MTNKVKIHKNVFPLYNLENNKDITNIFENPIFPYLIKDKEISNFSLIVKKITKKHLRNIMYIAKNRYKIKDIKKINSLSKDFFKKHISLFFIYFWEFYNNKDILYHHLFKVIFNIFKNSNIINNDDIIEIINYNIVYNLIKINNTENNTDLSLFKISIYYLIKNIFPVIQKQQINFVFKILDSIYKLLTKKTLFIFKNQNFNNITQLSLINTNEITYFIKNKNDEEIIKLKNKFKEVINLLYGFNINKNYNGYLLFNLRNAFIELKGKDYSKEKLINSLYRINTQIDYINNILNNEDKIIKENIKDKYMPKRYFVFNESNKSGLNFNPKISLFINNFTLIFSFKQTKSEPNKVYPLITLISEDGILFGVYLKNKKLSIYFQNEYNESAQTEIILNKSYLISIEYNKKKNDLIELIINGEEQKMINSGKIKSKNNTIVRIYI